MSTCVIIHYRLILIFILLDYIDDTDEKPVRLKIVDMNDIDDDTTNIGKRLYLF